jgi:nuclear factor of kappa light polypeptide gene enhancer in B-cells 2
VDANGNTPVHLAAMDKHLIDCLQLLLNTSNWKPAHALKLNTINYAGKHKLKIIDCGFGEVGYQIIVELFRSYSFTHCG